MVLCTCLDVGKAVSQKYDMCCGFFSTYIGICSSEICIYIYFRDPDLVLKPCWTLPGFEPGIAERVSIKCQGVMTPPPGVLGLTWELKKSLNIQEPHFRSCRLQRMMFVSQWSSNARCPQVSYVLFSFGTVTFGTKPECYEEAQSSQWGETPSWLLRHHRHQFHQKDSWVAKRPWWVCCWVEVFMSR